MNELAKLLTPENLIAVLGIFAAIIQWRKSVSLQRLQVETETARVAAEDAAENERVKRKRTEAEIEQIKADTEIRVQQAKDDTEERTFMREQAKRQQEQLDSQLKLNAQFQESLQEKEKRDEGNYRLLADTQRDTHIGLTNLIQDKTAHLETMIVDWNKAATIQRDLIQEQMKSFQQQLESVLTAIPTLGSEIGLSLAQQLTLQNAPGGMIKFPADDNPLWTTVLLKPTKPEVILFNSPSYHEYNRVQKPCARLKPEGQIAQIISGLLEGWIYVKKQNGEMCYGYLPIGSVQISDAAPLPEMVH